MSEPIAIRFARETANHRMTVLHDEGLYRHVRFKHPDTGFYWFDLITWPGRLSFAGDMDGYTFARTKDMFEFFRTSSRYGINPGYWSEKVDGGRDRTKRYSEDKFRELVAEHIADHEEEFPGLTAAVQSEILDNDYAVDLDYEDAARDALDTFRFKSDDGEFRFTDTWEWDLRDYDWTFLWACRAIVWGIEQYDAAKVAVPS